MTKSIESQQLTASPSMGPKAQGQDGHQPKASRVRRELDLSYLSPSNIFSSVVLFAVCLLILGCAARRPAGDSSGFQVVHGDDVWNVGRGQFVIYCTDLTGTPVCKAEEEKPQ